MVFVTVQRRRKGRPRKKELPLPIVQEYTEVKEHDDLAVTTDPVEQEKADTPRDEKTLRRRTKNSQKMAEPEDDEMEDADSVEDESQGTVPILRLHVRREHGTYRNTAAARNGSARLCSCDVCGLKVKTMKGLR